MNQEKKKYIRGRLKDYQAQYKKEGIKILEAGVCTCEKCLNSITPVILSVWVKTADGYVHEQILWEGLNHLNECTDVQTIRFDKNSKQSKPGSGRWKHFRQRAVSNNKAKQDQRA